MTEGDGRNESVDLGFIHGRKTGRIAQDEDEVSVLRPLIFYLLVEIINGTDRILTRNRNNRSGIPQ